MIGTVEFNSACFYRYANVDMAQLVENLDGDRELALNGLGAFLRALVSAVPSSKQNSMAAQDPPDFVMAVVRDAGLWQLANAFAKPVRPTLQKDLVTASVEALDNYWGRLKLAYGEGALRETCAVCLVDADLKNLESARVPTVGELETRVLAAVGADLR